jgi:hypothetical protein
MAQRIRRIVPAPAIRSGNTCALHNFIPTRPFFPLTGCAFLGTIATVTINLPPATANETFV